MTPKPELASFQDRLGYRFTDPSRLELALTHASTGSGANYERLEFLGDRVLGLVIADLLYAFFADEPEGGLAKRHAALVCTDTLADIARALALPDIVIASAAERASGGASQDNLLADCLEALIGAAYLDGGLAACMTFIQALWGERIQSLEQPPLDPKTALQEWAQERKLPIPVYTLASKDGPDHAPFFSVAVMVRGHDPVTAGGASRRAAEKEAARLLLNKLERT